MPTLSRPRGCAPRCCGRRVATPQYWDSDDPPLFKSFLRLDVDGGTLRLRCFAATGCAEHEADPPVEDDLSIPLA
jgi:hypothetical protein